MLNLVSHWQHVLNQNDWKMKWKNFIQTINGREVKLRLNEPSTFLKTETISSIFSIELPEELIQLYAESNGIVEIMDEVEIGNLVWSIDQLISENQALRTNKDFEELYMSFDSLLFFGDAGNGDNFGYPICKGKVRRTDIYIWNHEDDSRNWIAPSLETFVKWWCNGQIKI